MLTKREAMFGILAVAASSVLPVIAQAAVEPNYCINPWRQVREGDAMVRWSEVIKADWIGDWEHPGDTDWLQIETRDGRELQTELTRSQPDARDLLLSLWASGYGSITFQCRSGGRQAISTRPPNWHAPFRLDEAFWD